MRKGLFSLVLFSVIVPSALHAAEIAGQPGRIYGESFVNLRSGPDLDHPSREILREGQEVKVERQEGSWYLVSLPDGSRGYVHRSLVRISGAPADEETAKAKKPAKASETGQAKLTKETLEIKKAKKAAALPVDVEKEEELPNPFAPQLAAEIPKGQPLPIIKVLEGREWEILAWFGVVLCVFTLGWICGGNYYLRRDRFQRTKIRF